MQVGVPYQAAQKHMKPVKPYCTNIKLIYSTNMSRAFTVALQIKGENVLRSHELTFNKQHANQKKQQSNKCKEKIKYASMRLDGQGRPCEGGGI